MTIGRPIKPNDGASTTRFQFKKWFLVPEHEHRLGAEGARMFGVEQAGFDQSQELGGDLITEQVANVGNGHGQAVAAAAGIKQSLTLPGCFQGLYANWAGRHRLATIWIKITS